jgi:hypothetical protein
MRAVHSVRGIDKTNRANKRHGPHHNHQKQSNTESRHQLQLDAELHGVLWRSAKKLLSALKILFDVFVIQPLPLALT